MFQRVLIVVRRLIFEHGDRHGPLVRGRRTRSFQYGGCNPRSGTVHDHGFEAIARDLLDSVVGLRAMLDFNINLAQNAAEHTDGFVVGGEQQALESGFHWEKHLLRTSRRFGNLRVTVTPC